jgi:hypothetical protein
VQGALCTSQIVRSFRRAALKIVWCLVLNPSWRGTHAKGQLYFPLF